MDDRQKQLYAAAEAMRTWVHAQRAMWAAGYPQSLVVQASPALASAGAVVVPSAAVLNHSEPAAIPDWPLQNYETVRSMRAFGERLRSVIATTKSIGVSSWRFAAAAIVVVGVAWTVRTYGSGMRQTVSSNLTAGSQAVKTQARALSVRAAGERAANSAGSAAPAAAKPRGGGRLQVDSNPAGAHVLVDGRDRGVTPVTIEGLSLGSHKVLIKGDDGSVQRTVSLTSADTVQLNEAIYSGWLHVSAPFEIQASEGRNAITLDESGQVLLAPGAHDIRFENRGLGVRDVRHVEIRPGETTAITLELPTSKLTVTSSEPAKVAIDGQPAGDAPLTDFVVPVGTRDISVTSGSGEVRHQTLTVTTQPAQIDIDFSKH